MNPRHSRKRRNSIRQKIRPMVTREHQLADAVCQHKLRHLKRMIDGGADINTTDRNGYTPLLYAAWAGDTEALDLLLQAGTAAGINHRDSEEGVTPLHAAVIICRDIEGASAENVFRLIAAGADANIPDRDGWTPLHSCAFYHLPHLIPALLSAGADPALRDMWGNTPGDIARSKSHTDIIPLLERAANAP